MSGQKLRVGYHAWQTYPGHRGRDGANFAYEEIGWLLRDAPGLVARPHDIIALCADEQLAREELRDIDVVVACAGPHAYLYFYLRHRLGLDFRIIRDVRTALWNAYFLQETLAQPLVRDSDLLVHSSAYSQAIYSRAFPGLSTTGQAVCYPLTRYFPQLVPRSDRDRREPLVLGFVGRMTDDKGYPQALAIFAACRRQWPGRYQMLSVGEIPDSARHDALLRQHLGKDRSGYRCVPSVPKSGVWQMYDQMSILLFPSTSSLETFGRVVVEASYAGIPVLAAAHGPAYELIDRAVRVPVTYRRSETIMMRDSVAMGNLDLDAAVRLLAEPRSIPLSAGYEQYRKDDRLFLNLVREEADAATGGRVATTEQAEFAARLRLQGLPALPQQQALSDISKLVETILSLHDWYSSRYFVAIGSLLTASLARRRTVKFLRRSIKFKEDLTNIGGMDMEFAHLLRFAPAWRLD